MEALNGLIKDIKKVTKRNYTDDKTGVQNMFYNYGEYSMKGIVEETPLSDIFFSKMNMDLVQKAIRYNVHQRTRKVIEPQSTNEIFIVMRSIYLQNGDSGTQSAMIKSEIQKLNGMVIDFCVKQVVNQLDLHDEYTKRISSLPIPLDNPIYDNKQDFTFNISNLM
jgi:hypothetical protein